MSCSLSSARQPSPRTRESYAGLGDVWSGRWKSLGGSSVAESRSRPIWPFETAVRGNRRSKRAGKAQLLSCAFPIYRRNLRMLQGHLGRRTLRWRRGVVVRDERDQSGRLPVLALHRRLFPPELLCALATCFA